MMNGNPRSPLLATVALMLGVALLPVSPALAAVCDGVHRVSNTALKSVVVASGLPYPLYVTAPSGDTNRLFIVRQDGFVSLHKRGDDPTVNSTFLNISTRVLGPASCDECGLLGLAFDPNYATNGFFYINYTENSGGSIYTVVARWRVSVANPDAADPASETRLLRFLQPESNHNGGWLAFGPDGYLYIATGDGGNGADPHGACGNGQDRTTLLGKILRIDVNNGVGSRPADCGGTTNYKIPANNPLVGQGVSMCEEIFAWGLRNPWRPAFDPANGDMYIADVGQNCWEEVNYVPAASASGRNYGWRQMEGTHCFNANQASNCNPSAAANCSPACRDASLTLPIIDYSHSQGCSITGGFVYRGCQMPGFAATYFYGDYCDGWVKSFKVVGGAATAQQDWTATIDPAGDLIGSLTSFGTDAQGELYITDRGGQVRRISPPFTDLEVSGQGVLPQDLFRLGKTSWTWEDLKRSTMHPVSQYRVYRATSVTGVFSCIFKTATTSYAGDPQKPAATTGFFYLVVAVSPDGELTKNSKIQRTLSPSPCP